MAKTLYSMGTMSAVEAWREIRSIRAELTGSLGTILRADRSRRDEFHMALEQGQQQFAAAPLIGYESRALNLFYGLSQAGRAIAAGSKSLGSAAGEQWQGSGHGIKFSVGLQKGLWDAPINLQTNHRDLFSRVSLATDSPHKFDSITFGALVNQLVDYTMAFREPEGYPRPLHDVRVYGASTSFPVDIEVAVPGSVAGRRMNAGEVGALFGKYPALAPFSASPVGDEIRWSHNEGYCLVTVPSRESFLEETHGTLILKGSTVYRGSNVLLPCAAAGCGPLRPLMAWWLVLYALSMLARYTPSKWMETLSLAQSPVASKVEFILDTAMEAVPELLVDEMERLRT
ncbi:YaaC family protein [Salinibacterium sp. SWN167]|uniref:YaaC family protein n=1 Tax=Salinibacterium sp. SWN167 TaxID=2792054 RepID=UPI0018CE2D14|nr:hypothetical protein [Salinibacterium sp. SWN167]MBH0082228.1 hypothetical protein [Salinibacterium sp. SWN167]